MRRVRSGVVWAVVCAVMFLPILKASFSPLLAWRNPIYILAGFAGILAMSTMVLQPLLAAGYLPGLSPRRARQVHRWVGVTLVVSVVVHVVGLWVTSPPDVIDALTFTSPTPFSAWGVIAMWAIFAAACMAVIRKRLPLRTWRRGHTFLVVTAVVGVVVHALLIEGTMETVSKLALCALVLLATVSAVTKLRAWTNR